MVKVVEYFEDENVVNASKVGGIDPIWESVLTPKVGTPKARTYSEKHSNTTGDTFSQSMPKISKGAASVDIPEERIVSPQSSKEDRDFKRKLKLVLSGIDDINNFVGNTINAISDASEEQREDVKDLTQDLKESQKLMDAIIANDKKVSSEEAGELTSTLLKIDKYLEANKRLEFGDTSLRKYLRKKEKEGSGQTIASRDISDSIDRISSSIGVKFGSFVKENAGILSSTGLKEEILSTAAASFAGPLAPIVTQLIDFNKLGDKIKDSGVSLFKTVRMRGKDAKKQSVQIVESSKDTQEAVDNLSSTQEEWREDDMDNQAKQDKLTSEFRDDLLDDVDGGGSFAIFGKLLAGLLLLVKGVAVVATFLAAFKVGTKIWESLPENIQGAISNAIGKTVDFFTEAPRKIVQLVSDAFEFWIPKLTNAYNKAINLFSSSIDFWVSNFNKATGLFTNAFTFWIPKISSVGDRISVLIDKMPNFDEIKNIGSVVADKIGSAMQGILSKIPFISKFIKDDKVDNGRRLHAMLESGASLDDIQRQNSMDASDSLVPAQSAIVNNPSISSPTLNEAQPVLQKSIENQKAAVNQIQPTASERRSAESTFMTNDDLGFVLLNSGAL